MPELSFALVTTFLLLALAPAGAFAPRPAFVVPSHNTSRHPTFLRATQKLVFQGNYVAQSDPLPVGTTKRDIAQFLAQPDNQQIFFTAGGTREMRQLAMTPQFKAYWEDVAAHFGSPAHPSDSIIAVDTSVKFPGMKLVTTTVSGITPLGSDERLEVLLIAEKSEAQGAAPVVWLFNKLTGYDKKEKGVFFLSSLLGGSFEKRAFAPPRPRRQRERALELHSQQRRRRTT